MKVSVMQRNGRLFPVVWEKDEVLRGKEIKSQNVIYDTDRDKDLFSNLESIDISEYTSIIPINPSKILCPALNFKTHSKETNQKNPDFPYFFSKMSNAITSYNEKVIKHKGVEKLDYEGEIAAIIGKKTYMATSSEARSNIGGFAVVNDVSARDYQNQFSENLGKNWIMGKTADTFLPISNSVFLGNEEEFDINTEVNGQKRQAGKTSDMIFTFSEMISYLSKGITLYPGDMILSGTPEGVAASGKYSFLKTGDVVKISSEKIGFVENTIN
jgi:2-keto-4-pentenoate hydratase/2-oxohepta-3-ene-1,7-dioic acid hydratase in catechol pathway